MIFNCQFNKFNNKLKIKMKIILVYMKRRISLYWLLKVCFIISILVTGYVAYIILFPKIIYINSIDISNYLIKTSGDEYKLLNLSVCSIAEINEDASLINVQKTVSEKQLDSIKQYISLGGEWMPTQCISQHHTAIIVCYRNRTEQLQVFLYHMHSFLRKQNLHYQIYIIEQTFDAEFNRGKLFNIGYREATLRSSARCFIFHDIDLIPENINNIYGCTSCPRHMSTSINVFNYSLPYYDIFGGAIAMTRQQFHKVNGFSNLFYGWGGEDDDIYNRVYHNHYKVCRYSLNISRYTMLSHDKETPNKNRLKLLKNGPERFKIDGVNSVTYNLIKYEQLPLYTRILVSV